MEKKLEKRTDLEADLEAIVVDAGQILSDSDRFPYTLFLGVTALATTGNPSQAEETYEKLAKTKLYDTNKKVFV